MQRLSSRDFVFVLQFDAVYFLADSGQFVRPLRSPSGFIFFDHRFGNRLSVDRFRLRALDGFRRTHYRRHHGRKYFNRASLYRRRDFQENRAKGMGLFGATFGLGFIFGPAIGGILSRYGISTPFLFAAALSVVNAILVYLILPETVDTANYNPKKARKNRFAEIFESLGDLKFGTLNAVYFFLVTSFSIMTYAFVLYTIERFDYTAEENGYIFAFIGILAVIFQGGLFNKLVKKFGENPLVIIGCLMMAISLFVIPYIGPDYGGLFGVLFTVALLAIGNSMASPAITSLASKISDDATQGASLGVLQSFASLARAIGPAVGGILLNNAVNQVDDFTVQRTFWTASAIMIVTVFIAVYFAKINPKKQDICSELFLNFQNRFEPPIFIGKFVFRFDNQPILFVIRKFDERKFAF